jgi:hypothetical protein
MCRLLAVLHGEEVGYVKQQVLDLGAKGGVELCKQTVCFRALLCPTFLQRQRLYNSLEI